MTRLKISETFDTVQLCHLSMCVGRLWMCIEHFNITALLSVLKSELLYTLGIYI